MGNRARGTIQMLRFAHKDQICHIKPDKNRHFSFTHATIQNRTAPSRGEHPTQPNTHRCFFDFLRFSRPIPVSRAKILGNSELFIKSGSDINLTCVALQSPAPPSFIYWYKGGRVVNYSQRGGISVLTERQTKTSKLVIARAVASDSGNYTCSPSSSGKYLSLVRRRTRPR